MVTQNPNIDGTIRIVIEYADSQSSEFADSANSPDFPSSAAQNAGSQQQGGRFDIAGALQRFSQEQISYAKETISVLSSIAVSMGVLTQSIGNLNSTTIKAMSQEARKDAEFRAANSRKNREFNQEQGRKNEINAPRVEAEQNRAEKALADALKANQGIETEEARTSKEQYAADLMAAKVVEQLEKTGQAIITSQEKIARENMTAESKIARDDLSAQAKIDRDNRSSSNQTRNRNRSARNLETRLDERQVEILERLAKQTATAEATTRKEEARAFTAEQYSQTAEQRKEDYQYNYQRRLQNRDVNRLSDERRREYEQQAARRRDIIATLGEKEGGKVLYGEERDKRRQTEENRREYDKEHGINTQFDKNIKQMQSTLDGILGIFTFGVAFKNSKVANDLLGTISRIMGVLMDVFLTPFLPLLVPMIHALAKLVPMLQGFIQSFSEDPKGTIIQLIKDIFSPGAWKDLLSNLFPEMSAGDILKVIFGSGAALLGGGALLTAPIILMKLFGAGTGLLTRGVMSLLGRGGGASGETASNVMFSRSVGGFSGSVAAFTRAVGMFGLRGGIPATAGVGATTASRYAGSRYASTMIGPPMPASRYAAATVAAPMAATSGLQRVPGVIGVPGVGRGTVGFSGTTTSVSGMGARAYGGGLGTATTMGMVGMGGFNRQAAATAGMGMGAGVRSSRTMATAATSMARSTRMIGGMSNILLRIVPLIGGLMAALGPLALIAGLATLPFWMPKRGAKDPKSCW